MISRVKGIVGLKCGQTLKRNGLRTSKMAERKIKKGATKHCSWGLCTSDSRYPDKLKDGVFFIRFCKPGRVKDDMTNWQKEQEKMKTEKAKRWLHACGRKNFSHTSDIKKDSYICSLHFIGENGPTDENPDPIKADPVVTSSVLPNKKLKRKPPKERQPLEQPKCKKVRTERCDSSNSINSSISIDFSTSNEIENENIENFAVDDEHEILNSTAKVHENDSYENQTEDNSDNNLVANVSEKSTQTLYDSSNLNAKIEEMVHRNKTILGDESEDVPKDMQIPDFRKGNPMDPQIILQDRSKCKYFTGLYTEEFDVLFDFFVF